MKVSDCFVSVVAPLYNSSEIVVSFIEEVLAVLPTHYSNYELILIDDGSDDDGAEKVATLLPRYSCIRLIRLSRRFGIETAISSGLDSAIGDFVVVMLPDEDPPELIPEMVRLAQEGAGVVSGIRKSRTGQPLWLRWGASLFYWISKKLFDLNMPKNSTHFRVLSRQAVNALSRIKDNRRYLRLLSSHIGFLSKNFLYEPMSRSDNKKSKGFGEALSLSLDIIISNSLNPLRSVTWCGLIAAAGNFLYAAYVAGAYLFRERVAEGWTTLSLQTSGMFFFLSLMLAVLSEYIGRILFETKERPRYHVLEEKNSSIMLAEPERRNIVRESMVPR